MASPLIAITMGIVVVACLATRVPGVPWVHRERGDSPLNESFERGLDLAIGVGPHDMNLPAEDARGLLDVLQLVPGWRIVGIQEDANRCRPRYQLMQQPEALGFQRMGQETYPGGVSARPVEARRQPCLDRIAPNGEDDWNVRGCGLGRQRSRFAAG
jgi:hypothetical protein